MYRFNPSKKWNAQSQQAKQIQQELSAVEERSESKFIQEQDDEQEKDDALLTFSRKLIQEENINVKDISPKSPKSPTFVEKNNISQNKTQ